MIFQFKEKLIKYETFGNFKYRNNRIILKNFGFRAGLSKDRKANPKTLTGPTYLGKHQRSTSVKKENKTLAKVNIELNKTKRNMISQDRGIHPGTSKSPSKRNPVKFKQRRKTSEIRRKTPKKKNVRTISKSPKPKQKSKHRKRYKLKKTSKQDIPTKVESSSKRRLKPHPNKDISKISPMEKRDIKESEMVEFPGTLQLSMFKRSVSNSPKKFLSKTFNLEFKKGKKFVELDIYMKRPFILML